MNTRRDRGFTLVEMMVVIVIIGILATIVIVNISGKGDIARMRATEAILKQVGGQLEMFKLTHNKYPVAVIDLFRMPPYIDPKEWPSGGYLTDPPVDGWNHEFFYRVPGSNGAPFDLYSLGEDGREGGEGPAADIHFRKQQR
ncbi:MAG TPA: type II secretion system major pseudopilin GspG [Planctomycetota bacterium]|nr:type II secretion system major pseudopilin GspG [Planctomycetota bacterium]